MAKEQKYQKLKQIKDEVLELKASPLYEYRQQHNYKPVIGEGDRNAEIMFIGEAPGENEAQTARPFCGAAGRVLDELLQSAGLSRNEIYITNIVKDRPPSNRDPQPEEIKLYAPFLIRQINIIQPSILAPLGRFAMEFLMKHYGLDDQLKRISQLHGRVFEVETDYGTAKLMPLYHPAVGLYQATQKPVMKQDFEKLARLLH